MEYVTESELCEFTQGACGTIASIGEANEAKAAAPGCPYAPTFDSSADQVSQQVSPYRLLRQLCA